ncbi:response regulator transcription factor [Vogesella sp. LIG4]|uniref:response regulator transcription factor n=1 Tax=Vogesella sp. LIG4 TaxID=1192162 RepID=UPI00081FA77C|nr:response regulator [Vogesella sp. LIG4]SCK22748.1 two component transcriptional regulator, LuxR family [Vogesella sp. LIG4]
MQRLAVIDDDLAVRQSLLWLLESPSLAVSGYDSAEAFLADSAAANFNCLIVDLRMGGMSGIMLLEKLAAWPYSPPVLMLTAHGDVPHAVAAFKQGVVDFLEKPFDDQHLLTLVEECLARDSESRERFVRRRQVAAALQTLTEREREVMQLILAGLLNKQIAEELAISMKTVEVHRARVFDKMGVKSAVELAGLIGILDDKGGKA